MVRRAQWYVRSFAAVLTAMFCFLAAGGSLAQVPLELAIKATYLYKFAPFVEWPATAFDAPAAPLNICVIGSDPFGATLDQAVANQRVGTHPIAVVRLAVTTPGRCHVAFVSGPNAFVGQALDALRGTPVLTVTDGPQGSPRGIIHFVVAANHVRFDIDDEAAARNGITISSKLLNLARTVRQRP